MRQTSAIIESMKLILAVVQDTDADVTMAALTEAGHRVTRVASTGGFFRQGNTTLLCGVEDDQVEGVLSILKTTCQRRTRLLPINLDPADPLLTSAAYTEVPVGGATVFVLNVERFEHI